MKIFRAVLVVLVLLTVRAEARDLPVIGIVDFTSRVTVTNLSDEQILTFHTAPAIIMDEIISHAEIVDMTGDATAAIMDEILVMTQVGRLQPEIQELAAAEECDYILLGYLMNLSRTTGEKIIGKSDGIRASLSARIFDVRTGRQVAVFTGRGVSKARVNRIGRIFRSGQLEFSEDSLNAAIEQAALEISGKIKRRI